MCIYIYIYIYIYTYICIYICINNSKNNINNNNNDNNHNNNNGDNDTVTSQTEARGHRRRGALCHVELLIVLSLLVAQWVVQVCLVTVVY